MAVSCGPICICCSGCRSSPSSRAGWVRTTSRPGRWYLYGTVLWLAGLAYFILTRTLIADHGRDSALATALGRDFKGKASLVGYAVAIPLAFVNSWCAGVLYVLVAVMWLIPDRRLEKALAPGRA